MQKDSPKWLLFGKQQGGEKTHAKVPIHYTSLYSPGYDTIASPEMAEAFDKKPLF
jgi:hypothetical protein